MSDEPVSLCVHKTKITEWRKLLVYYNIFIYTIFLRLRAFPWLRESIPRKLPLNKETGSLFTLCFAYNNVRVFVQFVWKGFCGRELEV